MAGPNGQAPMAWRLCGNQLKLWRTDAGVSREALGEAARYSVDTVKAMEQGVRMPTRQLLEAADELCRAGGKLVAASPYLKREKFPAYVEGYARYEAEAVSLAFYAAELVPGLLQTEAYARALIGGHCPPLDDETVEERIAARLDRQKVLDRKPPVACNFIVYEAALRCPIGGARVLKGQLSALVDAGRRRNVSLQVLPFSRAVPAALSGPVVLVETHEHERLAYVESQAPGQLTSDPNQLSVLTQRHGMIRSQALSMGESEEFIQRLAEEL